VLAPVRALAPARALAPRPLPRPIVSSAPCSVGARRRWSLIEPTLSAWSRSNTDDMLLMGK
jgi:hypothetical protein